ncbi:MAG TPA: alpha/beta hydrolase [Acidimicrobiales bacterium]|nr:alpha/beta hydrolase [Acidimicrobiales bacterium]
MDTTAVGGFSVPSGGLVALPSGQRLWVHDTGDAPGSELPVVLLHGLGATAALNWFAGMDALARRRRVIALDLPGHGRSPRRGRFRLEQVAEEVGQLLDELGIEQCIVAGYSMGGVIAQLMARQRPDLVRGLVLCATSRDFRGRPADRLRFGAITALAIGARLVPLTPAQLVRPVARRQSGDRWRIAAELSNSSHLAICEAADALGRFTSRTWLHELQLPATVVLTTQDRLVPPNRQRKLAESLPDARVIKLDGDHLAAGRLPVAFRAALLRAVTDVSGRATRAGRTAA